MEIKWAMIAFSVIFVSLFIGLGISEYQKTQCKLGYAWSGKTAEDIVKICGK